MMTTLSHVELERYFVVLSVIEQSGQTFTQQKLADYFQIDKASVVRVVDYLVQREVITRQVNTQDRREYFLVLTEKGKRIVPEIRQSIRQLNETAFRHFTPEQTEQFFLALDTIGQNLSEVPMDEDFLNFHPVRTKKRPKATANVSAAHVDP